MIHKRILFLLFPLVVACQSTSSEEEPLFQLLDSESTGINFVNEVKEDDKLNVLEYQYLYNGAGVAVGDVNNDGLADVYFSGNMVENKLYLNKGSFHFEDITEIAGVAGRKKWKTGVSMADVNGDGKLDIYVCYSGPGTAQERKNELYINTGTKNGVPTFIESAAKYGLDAEGTFTTQVVFFDMDKDGDLDVFMVNHAEMFYNAFYNTTKLRRTRHPRFGNKLYRNDQGYFKDISEEAGIDGSGLNFGLNVSIADVNNDTWADLYVTNDYTEQDFLYLNQQNGHFKEVLKESMGHISKFSMGSAMVDVNNDLKNDVISLDMLPEDNFRQKLLKGPDEYDRYQLLVDSGFHHQNMRNMLQINVGNNPEGIPQFTEIGQLAGVSNTDWSWSPLVCDLDNDGNKDLYVTNGYLRDFTNMDFLKYTYQEEADKAKAQGKKMNTWELIKQMPSTKVSNYCFANKATNEGLIFENTTEKWGLSAPSISTGAAYADLDNDGDLDLIVNNSNSPVMVFQNRSRQLSKNHYIKLKLQENSANTFGLGAKVFVQTAHTSQMQELYSAHGFQSSVEPSLHFGLGKDEWIKSVEIHWTNGKVTTLQHIKADTTLTIQSNTAKAINTPTASPINSFFTDYTAKANLRFQHQETPFVDFKHQSLLPYQLSKQGPFIAKSDVNADGLEDIFIGGNQQKAGELFLQKRDGSFQTSPSQPWAKGTIGKDAGVLFFDADNDKDLDLFIAKGGVEFDAHASAYQDQLYLNNGKGIFTITSEALPDLTSNGSCVAVADYDKDGDIDIFVGGRSMPSRYPEPDYCYLLKNESKNGKVLFRYASEQKEPSLRRPGMVTSATWTDINKDGWLDLVVAGEFMPITIYENQRGQLVNQTQKYGLENTNGFWAKVIVEDMDNDGDLDIVAGNLGQNTQFKASEKEPITLCYADFDQNGTIDPLICYYIQGKSYPLASLDELANQLPSIRKKFLKYKDYAEATLETLLSPEQIKQSNTLKINTLSSTFFENVGNGKFSAKVLPLSAQVSLASCISVADFNQDGKKDILVAGNFYPWRVQLGRNDASMGSLLLGNGKGKFTSVANQQAGLLLKGDVRDMLTIQLANQNRAIFYTQNSDKVGVLKQLLK
ncbi:VCBS repeat-containing protein [Arcicella rigui]|uniref:VCBS repeat-containing protein n=1 Tax=Arcicella rigui TaxID=797020 RepID=A0ABU5QCV1_9BACT|nr:VCBS repeat-containing protein [Arcicella rigui]MEA5140558.1 VCBS repeat-containing protein [Arcicella rigui]